MALPRVAALACLVAALPALPGCGIESSGYMLARYGTAYGVPVRLGCNDTYEVFDRPDAGALVVVTNPISEAMSASCAEGLVTLPQEERLRRVARIYLDEKTNREKCVLTRELRLSAIHIEHNYLCPPPPGIALEKPGRRGRAG